jgi:MSHA biogenesis protein MshK
MRVLPWPTTQREPLAGRVSAAALGAGMAILSHMALAEILADPTQPAGAGMRGGAPTGPVLQSVLISPGRRLAVIDGQTVQLGGKFGSATVVSITEVGVVLKDQEGTRQLRLFPRVDKRVADNDQKPARAAPGRGQGNKAKGQP